MFDGEAMIDLPMRLKASEYQIMILSDPMHRDLREVLTSYDPEVLSRLEIAK